MSELRTIRHDGLDYIVEFTLNGRARGPIKVSSRLADGGLGDRILLDEINPTVQRDRDGVVSAVPEAARIEVGMLMNRVADTVFDERKTAATEESNAIADGQQGQAIMYEDAAPWEEPVNGAELLADLEHDAHRFLILAPPAYIAKALWALHTYVLDSFAISPVLAITSPGPGCGKTQALRWLGAVVFRAEISANATASYLFRVIELHRPTILIDEADSYLGENEKIRALVNSGYASDGTFRLTVGDDHEPRAFRTFAAKAIAAIGDLPRTIAERSIPIEMQKKTRDEKVERIRPRQFLAERAILRRRMARWTEDHREDLREATPELPEGLTDRQCDLWEPLLAIAEAIGPECLRRATDAALILCGVANEQTEGTNEQLLSDLRDVFYLPDGTPRRLPDGKPRTNASTASILDHLRGLVERPWPTWYKGKPMDERALAGRLKPYKVKSKTLHDYDATGKDVKGYELAALADAFRRYSGGSSPVAVRPSQALQENDLRDSIGVPTQSGRTDGESSKSLAHNGPDGGTDIASLFGQAASGNDLSKSDRRYHDDERRGIAEDL